MIEKMLGGAVEDIVLDTIVDRVNELKASRQWEKLFAETNEFILTKVDNGDLLLGDIAVLLSGDDIRQLARDSKQESKFSDTLRSIYYGFPFSERELILI